INGSRSNMGKLQGRVALVTGGTEGIGLAVAKLFVEEGAYLFITGRRQKELDEAVKTIGDNVAGIQGDSPIWLTWIVCTRLSAGQKGESMLWSPMRASASSPPSARQPRSISTSSSTSTSREPFSPCKKPCPSWLRAVPSFCSVRSRA